MNGGPGAAVPTPRPSLLEVRLAVSAEAGRSLSEPRLRRLLEIELEDGGILAPGTGGPLGDHVAYVWIDMPRPSAVVIETRVADRPVARREMAVGGVPLDVASRYVAIAAAKMIRARAEPQRPKRPPAPKPPTPEEVLREARREPSVVAATGVAAAFLPGADAAIVGPTAEVSFRLLGASERLFTRLLAGSAPAGAVRWFEVGLAGEYRVWLGSAFRVGLGGAASAAAVHIGGASEVDAIPRQRDTWSARAVGMLSLERQLVPSVWLGLALEPGAVLRPVSYRDGAGSARAVEGAWLGASLGLHLEQPLRGYQVGAKPAATNGTTRSP